MPTTHFITLTEAAAMTSAFRSQKEDIMDTNYKDSGILPLCETFDRAAFDALLSQTGCEKIRIYHGMDEDGKVHSIIVSVDDHDVDMLPGNDNDFVIVERSQRCPSDCPSPSDLNSD